jgi:hypothetical protein
MARYRRRYRCYYHNPTTHSNLPHEFAMLSTAPFVLDEIILIHVIPGINGIRQLVTVVAILFDLLGIVVRRSANMSSKFGHTGDLSKREAV